MQLVLCTMPLVLHNSWLALRELQTARYTSQLVPRKLRLELHNWWLVQHKRPRALRTR